MNDKEWNEWLEWKAQRQREYVQELEAENARLQNEVNTLRKIGQEMRKGIKVYGIEFDGTYIFDYDTDQLQEGVEAWDKQTSRRQEMIFTIKNLPNPEVDYSYLKPYERPVFWDTYCPFCNTNGPHTIIGENSLNGFQERVCLNCRSREPR